MFKWGQDRIIFCVRLIFVQSMQWNKLWAVLQWDLNSKKSFPAWVLFFCPEGLLEPGICGMHSCVSFVVGCFPDISLADCNKMASHVGMAEHFWLIGQTKISRKAKMFVSRRFEPVGHPHLWSGCLYFSKRSEPYGMHLFFFVWNILAVLSQPREKTLGIPFWNEAERVSGDNFSVTGNCGHKNQNSTCIPDTFHVESFCCAITKAKTNQRKCENFL